MRATHVEWRGKLKVGRIVAHIRARRRSWKTRVQFSTVKSTWRRRRGRPEVDVGHFGENSAYFCIKCCGPVTLPSPSPLLPCLYPVARLYYTIKPRQLRDCCGIQRENDARFALHPFSSPSLRSTDRPTDRPLRGRFVVAVAFCGN